MAEPTIPRYTPEEALDRRRARNRAYMAKRRIEQREHVLALRAKHTDTTKAYRQRYYRENADALKAAQATYRTSEKGRAQYKAWRLAYYSKPSNRLRLLAKAAGSRARQASRDFSRDVIIALAANPPERCACCDCPLDYSYGGRRRWTGPSIDRIDSERGYVSDNVAVICMRCNTRKTNFSIQELQMLLRYMQGGPAHNCASY
jgi:hypothetical protein